MLLSHIHVNKIFEINSNEKYLETFGSKLWCFTSLYYFQVLEINFQIAPNNKKNIWPTHPCLKEADLYTLALNYI